ncbi:MAG: hypothetical protein KGQ52_13315 [Alphaproteobacteria bacterium]|nr:hypothetical protein [Alphaproteobacteria bacterium]
MTALLAPMPPADQALKRAAAQLVHAAGGCDAAAGLCRVGKSQLAAFGSITEPDRFMPVDVLRDLAAVTRGHAGQLALLGLLAANAGCVLVPVTVDGAADLDPLDAISVLSKETAELVAALAGHAQRKGSVRSIVAEADDLVRKAASIRAWAMELERGA